MLTAHKVAKDSILSLDTLEKMRKCADLVRGLFLTLRCTVLVSRCVWLTHFGWKCYATIYCASAAYSVEQFMLFHAIFAMHAILV